MDAAPVFSYHQGMPRGLLVLVLFLFALGVPAAAAEPTRITVRVTVVETVTRKPVPRAHVRLLSDARQYDGFSGADGVVEFTGVVSANYGVRVDADGYSFGRDADVTASGAATQSLTVTGVRTKLSKIGAVAARSRPAANLAQGTTDTDSSAIIAGGVGRSLDSIPAIGRNAADGSLLIHNHDGSTTAATINGAPIFPSGTKNQLGLLGTDIFSSAALGASAVAGAPNGSLDLRTYDPTIDWVGMIQERAASFGGSALTLQERGTAGRVGLSFVHAQEDTGKPLDGLYYADTAGSPSIHHANPQSNSDTFTARYGFDANHVALLDFASMQRNTPLICTEETGPLPCGYGSGNRTVQRGSYVQLRDTLQLDRASLELHLFQSRTDNLELFANKVSAGTGAGFENTATTDRHGYVAKLGWLYAGSRIAHLTVSGYNDVTRIGGSFVSSAFPPPVASSVTSLAVDVPVIAARKFGLSAGARPRYQRRRQPRHVRRSCKLPAHQSRRPDRDLRGRSSRHADGIVQRARPRRRPHVRLQRRLGARRRAAAFAWIDPVDDAHERRRAALGNARFVQRGSSPRHEPQRDRQRHRSCRRALRLVVSRRVFGGGGAGGSIDVRARVPGHARRTFSIVYRARSIARCSTGSTPRHSSTSGARPGSSSRIRCLGRVRTAPVFRSCRAPISSRVHRSRNGRCTGRRRGSPTRSAAARRFWRRRPTKAATTSIALVRTRRWISARGWRRSPAI